MSYPERCDSSKYISELIKEIKETTQEIKPNNIIHLQDEIGDIFRDLLGLIESLRNDGYIDSLDNIITIATKKYQQRVKVCDTQSGRDKVKKIQKQELAELHNQRYGNN